MPEESIFRLTAEEGGQRLDQFIAASIPDLSRSAAQRLIRSGDVRVNDRMTKPSYRLEPGDAITVTIPPPESETVLPEDIPLDVLYEDTDLVVINKPAGMVVHPAYGHTGGTVVNAALARWPEMIGVGGAKRAGIVHRLDKDTSGVMVLARTPAALADLQRQFRERTIYKRYLALVEGIPASSQGVIEAPIGRDPRQRKRMAVRRGGREARTRYTLIEAFEEHALLSVEPLTGRTHQIRIHLAWLGHPVAGDPIYGYRKQRIKMKRLFLHAAELHLDSPSTGERMRFEAPLPPDLQHVLERLRQER
ncbi:MAG TPA: RluA family pseudouridine synthase [Chloroflexi bacterium]|nr:RluA family pseudouridine synthase [Chloroflexota bacterium]